MFREAEAIISTSSKAVLTPATGQFYVIRFIASGGEPFSGYYSGGSGPTSPASNISVAVSPAAVNVARGGTWTFVALVSNTTNQTVEWSLSGAVEAGTAINATTGVLTVAGSEPLGTTLTVTAISDADLYATGTVNGISVISTDGGVGGVVGGGAGGITITSCVALFISEGKEQGTNESRQRKILLFVKDELSMVSKTIPPCFVIWELPSFFILARYSKSAKSVDSLFFFLHVLRSPRASTYPILKVP